MRLPHFLIVLAFLTASQLLAATKPNVVIFLTDDQGWGDLSVHGNKNLSTPHIDSLARDGATFDNFYVCAVCAPTRAEFLTGRYHPRTGVSGVSQGEGRLNPDETTIANVFKSAGYTTGAFGKWHNGTQSPYHPNDRGFDEYYGFTSGHWGHYFSPPLDHNGKKVRGKGYVVDDFTNHAIEFIKSNKDKPFFCYVPYNTPHSPMMIDDQFYDKFKDVDPGMKYREEKREDVMMTRAALAMCENIDWNVGRVLKQLEESNLSDNTIVLYFSDNGPNSYRWNGGMKGKKGSVEEGGLRSPFLIRWPAKIAAGTTRNEVTAAIDLLPSLADMAGVPHQSTKQIDGRSFKSLLLDSSSQWKPRNLFSTWRGKTTVRTQRFRLDGSGNLYDIQNDRGQHTDVSKKFPDIAKRLRSATATFKAKMARATEANKDRPFTVGYARSTTLPARDGEPHGTIIRSSKAPNNSFFKNWTKEDDAITWSVDVGKSGRYEAIVYYTCAKENVGATIRLSSTNGENKKITKTETKVKEAFNPPLYDKSKERVTKSHYFVKDFIPLNLGTLRLNKGDGTLRLTAPKITGSEAIDVHSIELIQK